MSDGSIERKIALIGPRGMDEFKFSLGDVVLAEWEDKLFYAKIQKIDRVSGKCSLIFDDDSVEECPFSKIHSVTETTAEIVCIICKDGTSLRPNEIVLCDKCGIGYHQNCHDPAIPAEALEFDAPWMCVYCSIGAFCPYLENPFESKPTRKAVRKTRIHTLRSGESFVTSGNSTEDERDSQRESIKAGSLPTHDMSSYYFSSHSHPREGGKPRGRPPFSQKTKPSGDNKRGRGTGRPPARPAIREREQHSERNTEFDAIQQRKLSHDFPRHSGEVARHQARYGSPVRGTRLVEESTEGRKLSPAREAVNKRYLDEPASKVAKVIAHRRDAPREKQRLTQDLARQKRLLSEDIARAELLQREQLTKKFADIFDKSPAGERVEMEDTKISKDNFQAQRCHEENNDVASMYDQCYGPHSPEFTNELTKERGFLSLDKNNDKTRATERESLFDRLLRKGGVQEMKNIEFVNESKVEVKEMRYNVETGASPKCNSSPLSDHVITSCEPDHVTSADVKRKLELEPLTFENVSDDELIFSDNDAQNITRNTHVTEDGLKQNGESPTFPKKFSSAENGIESEPEASCNGVEEECDFVESSTKNDLEYRKGNLFNNLAEYEPCECPSEEGDSNCENNATEGSAPVMYDNTEAAQSIEAGVDEQSDHSSIKSSKLAQLMEEPDMQCEHSSKHGEDCVSQDSEVSASGAAGEVNGANSHECVDKSGTLDPWNDHVYVYEDNNAMVPGEKGTVTKGEKRRRESDREGNSDSQAVEEKAAKKEIQSFGQDEKKTSGNNSQITEQNLENVGNESELSNIEGMSDAGELSEPEPGALLVRGKVKKKKRKKPKSNKTVHKSVVNNPRRKAKGVKGRAGVKNAAKSTKRIKQLDSESDDAMLRSKSNDKQSLADGDPNKLEKKDAAPNSPLHASHNEDNKHDSELNCFLEDAVNGEEDDAKLSPKRSVSEYSFLIEDGVAVQTASDNCDSGQEGCSLSDPQRSLAKENRKRDDAKKEKRLGVRQKRKSEEKEKERERSTPPHLISQNRYARDLPRHNWLVELLLQQKKLCTEDTLQQARAPKDEQSKEEITSGKDDELEPPEEKEEENTASRSEPEPEAEVPASPPKQSSHEEPATPPRDSFQTELHRSFLRRSFPPNVPRTLPRLKPSSPDSSLGSESVLKSNENNAPPPPPLKHALPSKESTGLEPAPKIRKIGDDAESKSDSQEEESVGAESPPWNNESASSEAEHSRKVITPIEILDDDDEKRKHGQDDTPGAPEVSPAGDEFSSAAKSNDSIQKDAGHSPSKSSTLSPPRRLTPLNNTKKPFSAVNPTIPGGIKDSLGRPMHMPPHRAAILIPVVPMHDGNGIAMPPGLGPTSPHMKGYSPRTFTPHLITHSAPVPGSGMFGNAMSPGNRFSANACGHHMHGNMKSGVPCKRDVNCPFHGNNPRGLPSGILSISHHGPMHAFGHHGHDHMSAVMSRERREGEKGLCPQPDCRTCQPDKHSPPGRDHMGDKSPLQGPKVVKPIAHVPNKRPPLMLSHLQQLGKPSPATLRELEALHDDKSRRLAGDLLLSPHQLQKSAEKPPREQVVPAMSPLHHDRRPLHQPLTLSDLNRRREEEMMRAKAEESLKSKTLPGEFIVPGLPSPSRVHSKHPSLPRSNEAVLLSPGRAQTSTSVSPSDKRDPSLLMRRHGDERDREHGSFMSDFLKPGPPRLRPLDESDVRLSSDRQRREEQILVARENSPFLRIHSAKDAAMHHGKQVEEKEGSSPRAVDLLGRVGRPGREVDGQTVRSIASHGNSGIMNIGLRQLDEQRKHGDEARQAGVREEQRVRERVSPELEHRLRLEQAGEHQARRRSLELLQIKEKDPKMELREKEGIRIPLVEREHSDELTLLRPGEGNSASRMAFERSSPIRHKMYPDRPFLAAGMSSRMEARLDPRMVALHELEMHRRGEAIRVSEPSHRELLSRMASSLPMNKGGPHLGKSFFVRPDVSLERRGANSARLASEIRGWSPPTSLASRDYGMMLNSRQAMERLAAAAGKPGTLLGEVIKDVPPHIRQDIERERERERQRLSLEQIEANRRLLHAELKDKVNPLVFSKEHQLRNEQKREQIDVLRAREKLLADRERFLVMERIAEERKRKFNEHESAAHGGMLVRHPSPPQFGRVAEREEYERVKRLKLSDPSVSIPSSIQLGKHLSSITVAASEGKSPKNHTVSSSQIRDKANEQAEARINRPRDVELVKKVTNSSNFERDSMWFRNRELSTRAQEDLDCKRAGLHAVAVPPGFLPPKPGSFLPPREESNSSGKPDEDEVNRCSVCRRNASFLCSGCQAAWYCSSECQLSAWGSHSGECGQKRRQ